MSRFGIVSDLVVLLCVGILLSLGTWQVQRMGWKADLIARLDERARAAPVPLPTAIADPDSWQFRPVTVTGRFLHDRSVLTIARPRQGQVGYEVVTPLVRPDGPAVLVNRGFVPMDRRDAARAGPDGDVTVRGVARVPQPPGMFQPGNRPGAETLAWIDIPAVAAAAGLAAAAPVVVEQAPTGGLPAGIEPMLSLPNNHLQYAVTWYSLAGVLVIVYALARRRRKP